MGMELLISTIGVEPLRCTRSSRRTKATYHFRKRCIQAWRAVTVSFSPYGAIPRCAWLLTPPALMLYYDGLKVPRQKMLDLLLKLEAEIGDLSESKIACRRFKLPLTFKSKMQDMAIQSYIQTQRPYASYLPYPMDLVLEYHAFSEQQF